MVSIFNRGKDKREREDFARTVTATYMAGHAQARAMKTTPQQQLDSLGKGFFLQQDEYVEQLIMGYCPEIYPAFSRLNATSKIEKPKDRELLRLKFQDLLLHLEMALNGNEDSAVSSFVKSLGINSEFRILDAMGGYRGKLVTEEIDRTTVKVEEPKKKGWI